MHPKKEMLEISSVTAFNEVMSVGLYSATSFHDVISIGRKFSVTPFRDVISVGCNVSVSAFLTLISIGRNSYKPICEVSQLGRTSINLSQFRWPVLRLQQCVLAIPCDNCVHRHNMTPPHFVDRGGRIHKYFSKSIVVTIAILDALAYCVSKEQVARILLRMWMLVKCKVSHKEKLKKYKVVFYILENLRYGTSECNT